MELHRDLGDPDLARDLLVGRALGQQAQDLELARRQGAGRAAGTDLGRRLASVGQRVGRLLEELEEPRRTVLEKLKALPLMKQLAGFFPRYVSGGPCQEITLRGGEIEEIMAEEQYRVIGSTYTQTYFADPTLKNAQVPLFFFNGSADFFKYWWFDKA